MVHYSFKMLISLYCFQKSHLWRKQFRAGSMDYPGIRKLLLLICRIEALLHLSWFSSYCWKTNAYMCLVWQICFEHLLLSHQRAHCFSSACQPHPLFDTAFVSAVLSPLHSPSHWYVVIYRRQFNVQLFHFTKQNSVENNYWLIVCFVQL